MKRRFDSSLINFLKELKAFHNSSGNSVAGFPSISGRIVNLHKLYKIVSSNGGFDKVSYEEKWPLILEELNIPEDCANASEVVKQIYQRYLERYERSRKKDATVAIVDYDADDIGDEDTTKYTPMYRSRRSEAYFERNMFAAQEHSKPVQNVPIFPPMPPNFARLYKSLLSGLPNEFDLGVSACLALSLHDNRIPLQPNHFSHFIDLLCAHAGVFGNDMTSLSSLYSDWRKADGLQFFKFWSNYVHDIDGDDSINFKDLLYNPNIAKFLDAEVYQHLSKTRAVERELPVVSKEGFVVEMISSVFRNLSFDAYNAVLMSGNDNLLRFLFLGSQCSYRNVATLCLDTLARLSPTLILPSLDLAVETGATLLTELIRRLLNSNDRAQILAGAEILASLCQNDSNFDDLCAFVDTSICDKLFQYLLVPDIHLVVNCAEAIYQISELGPSPCDVIAANEHHLTMILALTTVEAVAFGPDAIVNIKVVAQHGGMSAPPSMAGNVRFQPRAMPMAQNNIRPGAPPPPQLMPQPNGPQLMFIYASNWLRAVFEPSPNSQSSESLMEVFNEYLAAASYANNKNVFDNVHPFAECLSRVFPFVAIKAPPPGRIEAARIFGIKKIGQAVPPISSPPHMPPMPAVGQMPPQPLTNGVAVDVSKRPVLVPSQPTEAVVRNGLTDNGTLHVVGNPITAADMIDRERQQHELAIVKIENKAKPVSNGNVEKTNGEKESNGKSDTLDELLGPEDKQEQNGSNHGDSAVENGIDGDAPVAIKKAKLENESTKMSNRTDYVNGVVPPSTNGYHNGTNGQSKSDSTNSNNNNNNGHHDEASMHSTADSNNSAAVFASCGDSESAASIGGGDTSRMSTVSDGERRAPPSVCPSVGNSNSLMRIPGETDSMQQPPKSASPNTNSQSQVPAPVMPFPCRWGPCQEGFANADALHRHFVGVHINELSKEYGARSPCLWHGCNFPVPRLKWSLFTHVKEFHLNANPNQPQRVTHPDTETPPDAGLRAVLTNFCQTTPFYHPPPGFEGPVTKQMRLAGGLILRNLAKHSANGKRFVHRHVNELVSVAFAGYESSAAVSAALDLADQKL